MLLLPALNDMFDIATKLHPPTVIFAMLGSLALASVLLAGYGMTGYGMTGGKSRSWIHVIGMAGVIAVSVYVILDIEYPRLGLIRVDGADPVLIELRQSMQP